MAGFTEENQCKSLYDRGGLDAVTVEMPSDFEKSESAELHIAVTGEPGTGKSSFINALRRIYDGEEGAAPTGETETTMDPKVYPFPNKATVNIWVLPGTGTPNFEASEYLGCVNSDGYDFFIIFSASGFTENELLLAAEIQQRKKNVYFVRSKIDQDLESAKHREKSQFNENKTREKLRDDSVENLKRNGIKSPQVFLISSWNLEKFDLGKLQEVLEEDLPALKRRGPNITSSNMKKQALLSEIWKFALLSAIVAVVPITGLPMVCDVLLLFCMFSRYRTVFSLDDESLGKLAKHVGKMTEELRSEVKSRFGVKKLIINVVAVRIVVRFVVHFLPYRDFAVAGISFFVTYFQLMCAVEEMAEDSKRMLAKDEMKRS